MLRVRIATALILAALLAVSLFLVPPPAAVMIFAAAFTFAAWEWGGFGALRTRAARLAYTAVVAALGGASWAWTRDPMHVRLLLGVACLWWLIALIWLSFAQMRPRPWLALSCGVPVLVPAFIALARVQLSPRGFARGPVMVLVMLLLVFAADIGAYFTGRSFGRRKLAPRVSPGKTWEGALGGLAAVALVALAGSIQFGFPKVAGVAFGCAIGVFSIVGDLTESMFKRCAGLKDSGKLLPGHGGVLDRLDSVTAAAPLYALGLFGAGAIE